MAFRINFEIFNYYLNKILFDIYQTPLHVAAINNKIDIIKYFLKDGRADIEKKNDI